MSDEFYDVLNEYLGGQDDITDIRAVVRRCWFYDFIGHPLRIWQGQGKLFTIDGNEWLGTITNNGVDLHKTPALQDGRDGSSATYTMTLPIIDLPGEPARQTYDEIKAEQWRVKDRTITIFLAIFQPDEALRPQTPIAYFKELKMLSPQFSEKIEEENGKLVQKYYVSISAKDNNFGRSNVPRGTYTDTVQKQRARELGVDYDRGCEFVGLLANRTYQLP